MQWHSFGNIPVHCRPAGWPRFSSVHMEKDLLHPLHLSDRDPQECSQDCDHLMAWYPCESRVLSRCASPPGRLAVFVSGTRSDGTPAFGTQAPFRSFDTA